MEPYKTPIISLRFQMVKDYCIENNITKEQFKAHYFWVKSLDDLLGQRFKEYIELPGSYELKEYYSIINFIKTSIA